MLKKWILFKRAETGGVLVFVALCLVPLLLMLGLAIDSSYAASKKQRLQMAVDAAAKAGAAVGQGQNESSVTEARKIFAANTTTMTDIGGPDISVDAKGNVTVSASIKVSNMFMSLGGVLNNTYTVTATAASKKRPYGCIYALNTSESGAVSLGGGSQMNIVGCGIYANSSSSSAVQFSGTQTSLAADFLSIVGGYAISGGATLTVPNGVNTGATAVDNPLGTLSIPSYGACTYNNFTASGVQTINPGVYCNGITVKSGALLTLTPGQYIIDGGSLSLNSSTLIGNGVTIILTKKLTGSYGTVSMAGGSVVNLSAPIGNPSNPFNGVAIYQDPKAPAGGTISITGGAGFNVTGIVAFPNQTLKYSGGGSSTAPCTVLVANQLSFSGSATINCPSSLLDTYMTGNR